MDARLLVFQLRSCYLMRVHLTQPKNEKEFLLDSAEKHSVTFCTLNPFKLYSLFDNRECLVNLRNSANPYVIKAFFSLQSNFINFP